MPIEFYDSIDEHGNKVINLGDPSADSDAANLRAVKQAIRDLDWKQSVRVASQSNVNLSAPGASIDGVTLVVGDRVLIKAQTLGQENGIYDWQGAASPMTRSLDADTEITAGMTMIVAQGSNADQQWLLVTDDPIVVGTTVLVFRQLGGLPFTAIIGDGTSQTITVTHNLGTRDVSVTVFRNSGTFTEVHPEVQHTDGNTVTMRFTPAPSVNEFRVVIQ